MGNVKGAYKDIVGKKFGRLTVIRQASFHENYPHTKRYECKCDCGTAKIVYGYLLKSHRSTSCGCNRIKHGATINGKSNPLYVAWNKIRKNKDVCTEWKDKENGYISFEKWSLENGYKKNLSLVLINEDKSFSPNNCKWTSKSIVYINRNDLHSVVIDGVSYPSLAHVSRVYNISRQTLLYRYKKGVRGSDLVVKRLRRNYQPIEMTNNDK